jgi:thiamine biosynthesis lipoprotein
LNRASGGAPRPASPELLELCAISIQKSERTLGAFDASAGPLIELWKHAAGTGIPPSEDEIDRARERTGFAGIELDPLHGTARLARAGMALDFGAVGKGYALDRAARELEAVGIHSALLDFGGQLLALDAPPGEPAWIAGVRDPAQPDRVLTRIRLVRRSVSSSGDYERGMKLGEKIISHIVDPRSGRPVEGMLGTSVITPTAVEADGLSTALYVLGFDAAVRYAEEHGLGALIAARGGRPFRTGAFRACEVDEDPPR